MRHRRRGLDNGSGLVAGWNQLCLVYLSNGCRTRNPAAPTAGFHLFPALRQDTSFSQAWDDRTDDCTFGAMMSLALRQEFRKLRFQMIADRLGRSAEARASYERALALTQQEPERQFLQERIRQLK
jgi:hypothetical protein